MVAEAVLLSTCNRTEVYAVVEDEGARGRVLDLLAEDSGVERASLGAGHVLADGLRGRAGTCTGSRSSLDSMVVGEGQILGQVREAYRMATEEHCAGQILNRLFHTSLRVGKQVRSRDRDRGQLALRAARRREARRGGLRVARREDGPWCSAPAT